MSTPTEVALSQEAQRLYLNYALSVIQSRALPDVRDGLKPVQRRILYSMHHELHVGPDAKPAKCARIVGDVIGKYHPHGDTAVYEALVRMAQEWVMRAPLVEGQGNFGSLDGDGAAAYRYTEARLTKIAMELLSELPQKTVSLRPTFDATLSEPVVLPARFPNLLMNGAQGIAVGMATSIPPHNLGELCDALDILIDDPETPVAKLVTKVRGPDFPTGGELVSSKAEIKAVYETGQGTLKLRGEWKIEEKKGGEQIVITSVPYALEKASLVEKIAEVIISKKLPSLIDVRDESTDQVRVVLELKRDANPELVMAYLYKHTPLLTNIAVNLTCLVPSADNPDVPTPRKLNLKEILRYFLDFRMEVVKKRLEYDLGELERRLHILAGFEKVFDALDEIIKIIRASEGKADAASKIMKRFGLDETQTDAILELKLYRLAKLEILVIKKDAQEKRAVVNRLKGLLRSQKDLWGLIKSELAEIKKAYADKRRTKLVSQEQEPEFSAEDFIIDEDVLVIVSAQGWVKRQGTVKDLSTTRIREGDRVLACLAGSTRSTVGFFSSQGACYVSRIIDVPASTGYGDPLQKLYKFADGDGVVGAVSFDPRVLLMPADEVLSDGTPAPPYGLAVTRQGLAFRFSLYPHKDPSTRSGRKFGRLNDGDAIIAVHILRDARSGFVMVASSDGYVLAVPVPEVPLLSGPGKGQILLKLSSGAQIVTSAWVSDTKGRLAVNNPAGKRLELAAGEYEGSRAERGTQIIKKGELSAVDAVLPEVPQLPE